MEVKILKFVVKFVIFAVLFGIVSFFSKAEEFAKYRKNFEISKSGIINVRTKSSGYLKYKIKKGIYEIDIRELTQSTVMLNDSLESNNGKNYDPLIIESYHYRFMIDSKRSITLKQGYKTSDKSAKFKIIIRKIED
ncbi:MAG: hypothetical protein HG454_004940 [Clostridiales bacterium]|jgi:hypothetical protein|nr:hypothetical protein [Clostridiales bacterium]